MTFLLQTIKNSVTLITCLLLISLTTFAQKIPEQADPPRLVNDLADMLTAQEELNLEHKLRKYYDSTSTEIVIVTIASLEGEDPMSFATEIGHKWGVGGAKNDNGVVILLAKAEHKSFIATGYGMEPILTAGICKRITTLVMKPLFKQGQFYAGLDEAVNTIIGLASGQFKADQIGKKHKGNGFVFVVIFMVIIFMVISFLQKMRNTRHNHMGSDGVGPGLLTTLLLMDLFSNRGRGSSYNDFSNGGGDFGDFGGFGGGDFGGGGAGGDW
ncbi:MAG: hypothetical protein RL711_418 [Bacteroidota bacterium]